MSDFVAETREMLDAIAGEIVAWEAEPSHRAHLDEIFRFVHTVKGSCGFLDLPRLARLSHAAEDVLAEVRAGRRTPDATLVSAVLAIIDRIGEITAAIESGESLDDGEDQNLVAALQPGAVAEVVAPSAGKRAPTRSIRLPVELLDRLMSGVSDMVLARNELARRLREVGRDAAVDGSFERLSVSVAELRDAITRTRMQRLDHLFAAIPRMVRDLAAELGREVALELEGGDVELDREMIESIRDPLTHIIRNAIDHGIEPPQLRRASGKPPVGTLRITARQSGNHIVIEAIDDGSGINADNVAARAVASGVIPASQAATMSHARKLALIFEPGVSTARSVTAISGRGVGMDVVRANVERIGGVVEVDSQVGAGSRLSVRVPLTLTIMPALTVSIGGERFAIPRAAIDEIIRVGPATRIESLGGAKSAMVRGRRMPLVDAAALFGGAATAAPGILVVLRPAGCGTYALAVTAAHDHEELVVKAAAPAVMATGVYAGTTLPDSGRPMLLLDPAGIAARAGIADMKDLAATIEPAGQAAPVYPTLLFRDLDGAERAVRLAVVERIEDVARDAVRFAAGRFRLAHEGRLLPLNSAAPLPDRPRLRVLRLSDSATALGYAIDQVIDIVPLGPIAAPAPTVGPIAGVLLVGDRHVELLDAHWLFAGAAGSAVPAEAAPLCLIGDRADGWVRDILAPLVQAAGYRIAFDGDPDAGAPAMIVADDRAAACASTVPLIRLRADPAPADGSDESIYRYDRPALLAALRAAGAQAAA